MNRILMPALLCGVILCSAGLARAVRAEVLPDLVPLPARHVDRDVYGWQLMTHDERDAVRARLRAARSPDEAARIRCDNHMAMLARARERGVSLSPPPRGDCTAAGDGPAAADRGRSADPGK